MSSSRTALVTVTALALVGLSSSPALAVPGPPDRAPALGRAELGSRCFEVGPVLVFPGGVYCVPSPVGSS